MDDWYVQDKLKLSKDDWIGLLKDSEIFTPDDLKMVLFVYEQQNHQSTATEIACYMDNVHCNKITAINRGLAKRIYALYKVEPPANSQHGHRYWNVIYNGNKDKEKDSKHHFYWVLRPNLAEAISEIIETTDIFNKYIFGVR